MIIVLTGATGSGKSKLAINLAKEINGEIVNADAFQVYKDILIATASPQDNEKQLVPHHLYNFVPLNEEYNISLYQKDARKVIEDIFSRKKTPILVGGSGLYIRSALFDYNFNVDTSKIDLSKFEDMDNITLHKYLENLDINEANKIHPNNRRRVLRSIALCLALDRSKTDFINEQNHEPIYTTKFFTLYLNREKLYPLVNERVEKMFGDGLLEQTVPLIEKYGRNSSAFKAIGIKELFSYLDGLISLEEAKEEIKKNTRHYIRRQETFFNHQFKSENVSSLDDILFSLGKK